MHQVKIDDSSFAADRREVSRMLAYEGTWMRRSLQHGANDACGVGAALLGGWGKFRD